MSSEVQTANAGAVQKPVNTSNISASGFVAQRYKAQMEAAKAQKSQTPPPVEEKPIPEAKAEEPIEEIKEPSQEVVSAESQEEAKVLSQEVDIENMSEAELKELASKLGSKAVARFGELTAKRRAAEEQLAQLKAEIARSAEASPLEAKVENNPYASVSTPEDLQVKLTEVSEVIDWAEDLLDRSEDLAADDVVANVNGKEYTKRDVKDAARKARKARDTYLPAQHKEIKLAQDRMVLRQALVERSKSELSWMQGEDNDIRKQYEAMMGDERLKGLEKVLPDLAPQIPYLLAHAANSLYARKPVDVKPSVKLAPNSPIINQSADSLKPEVRQSKALKDLGERFGKSSSYKDFTKLRALQHSKL